MSNIRLQIRRDTAQTWSNTNAHLLAGEIGFESDTGRIKIGTDENNDILWNNCEYIDTGFSDIWKPLLPRTDNQINIGSDEKRFKDLYVMTAHVAEAFYIESTKLIFKDLNEVFISTELSESLKIQTQNGNLKLSSSGSNADITLHATGEYSDIFLTSDNGNISLSAFGRIYMTGDVFVSDSLTVEKNLEVRGAGLFSGSTFTVKAPVAKFGASTLEINAFEEGTSVSNGFAGLKIFRGTSKPYLFVFNAFANAMQMGSEDPVTPLETVASREWTNTFVEGIVSPQAILAKLKTVDGTGSGLDADFLDGYTAGQGTVSYIPVVNANGHLILGTLSSGDAETYHRLYVNGGIRSTGDVQIENAEKAFLRFREYPVSPAALSLFGLMTEQMGIQFQEYVGVAPAGVLGTCVSIGPKSSNDSLSGNVFNVGKTGRVTIGSQIDDGSTRLQISGNVVIRNAGSSKLTFKDTSSSYVPLTQRIDFKNISIRYMTTDAIVPEEMGPCLSLAFAGANDASIYNGINIGDTNQVVIGSRTMDLASKFQVNGRSYFNGDVVTRGIIYTVGPATVNHPAGGDIGARIQIGNDSFISDINKLHYIGITNDIAATEFGSLELLNLDTRGAISFGSTVRQMINLWTLSYGIGVQDGTWYGRTGLTFSFHKGGSHSNFRNDAGNGGVELVRFDATGIHIGPATIGLGNAGWFNSYGNTGWKNTQYGGGWYMDDDQYIRSLGRKTIMIEKDWDGVYGNLSLKGTAPCIVTYDTDHGAKWLIHNNADHFSIWRCNTLWNELANDWVQKMYLDSAGRPYFSVFVGSGVRTVYADPSGVLTISSSDERMKTNIIETHYGLNEVLQMRPVFYNWKDGMTKGHQREVGLIAQEIETLIPEVIGKDSDEMLSLDYAKLVPVLINAIKEQNERIENLESLIANKATRKRKV